MPDNHKSEIILDHVTVRMYRPGLGDCFLLTFHGKQGQIDVKRHMLIDCGVLTGTTSGSERLGKIIEDIKTEIKTKTGYQLHTLVVTHEHADHLSGFRDHTDKFKEMQIGEVWLGWTEDKDNPDVQDIYSTVRKIPTGVVKGALETLNKMIEERKKESLEALMEEFQKELADRNEQSDSLKSKLNKLEKGLEIIKDVSEKEAKQKAIQEIKKAIQDWDKETREFLEKNQMQHITNKAVKEANSKDKAIQYLMKYIGELSNFLMDNGMEVVKEIAVSRKGQKLLYLGPKIDNPKSDKGDPTVIPWDDFGNVRFHVLGPPVNTTLLSRSDPPANKKSLDRGGALNESTAFALAVMHLPAAKETLPGAEGLSKKGAASLSKEDVDELFELCLPFDSSLGIPLVELQKQPETTQSPTSVEFEFFRKYYGQGTSQDDKATGPEWRQIDWDWLAPAGSMALYLDGDINNTSLVLAIELGEGGKVMLFPGDAQYGNWKSWADTKRGQDLLERTVFYKVGHHGSHNATLIDGGLDLMGESEKPGFKNLVAMIPVDTDKAKDKRWDMPAKKEGKESLFEKLIEYTHGRMILACEGEDGQQCFNFPYQKPEKPPSGAHIDDIDWQDFLSAINVDKQDDCLWVEYTLRP